MQACRVCSSKKTEDLVKCEGVCGNYFHVACLKRGSRSQASGLAACGECMDIRPFHILKLLRGIFDRLDAQDSVHSLIADKVNGFASNRAFEVISDDLNCLNSKVDGLTNAMEILNESYSAILERTHSISSRVKGISETLDELHSIMENSGFPSASANGSHLSILPIIDDVRLNLRRVESDIGSSAVTENSRLVGSIAADVKSISAINSEQLNSSSSVLLPPVVPQTQCSAASSLMVGASDAGPSAAAPAFLADPATTVTATVSSAVGVSEVEPSSLVTVPPQCGGRPPSASIGGKRRRVRRSRNKRPAMAPTASALPLPGAAVDCSTDPGTDSLTVGAASACPDANCAAIPLRAALPPRCVFVSRVDPNTTEEEIANYLSSRVGIPRTAVACRKISSRHGYSYTASFRILVPDDAYMAVLSPLIWPTGSIVREFVPRNRSAAPAQAKNSSARSQCITPT